MSAGAAGRILDSAKSKRDKSLTEGYVRCSVDEREHSERDEGAQVLRWKSTEPMCQRISMRQYVSSSQQIITCPVLSRVALHEMLPFPTIYLCEQNFSVLSTLKTKQRNKLAAGRQMRLALLKLELRIEDLLQKKQEQRSR